MIGKKKKEHKEEQSNEAHLKNEHANRDNNEDSKLNHKKETGDESTKNANTKLVHEYAAVKESLQRLQAEFSNFRKRTEAEKSRFVTMATEQLIRKLLPVMDNFELALNVHKEETEFSKGIEMIYAQLKEVLDEEGLTPIVTQGKFDPNIHEAILVEETDDSENEVKQVLQSGYKIGDKVIRHAKVKISKKKQ